jgi:hypothetical protein
MPDDIFRGCLAEETAKAAAACTPKLDKCHRERAACARHDDCKAQTANGLPDFLPGMLVVIEGLTKCAQFNGLAGVVQYFDSEAGRYEILLASCDHQKAKVKTENLRLLTSM